MLKQDLFDFTEPEPLKRALSGNFEHPDMFSESAEDQARRSKMLAPYCNHRWKMTGSGQGSRQVCEGMCRITLGRLA